MSPELKDLLDDAARSPERGIDVDDIHARGRRSRRLERGAGVLAAVALIGGAAIGIDRIVAAPDAPVIDGPVSSDPTPSPAPTSTGGGGRTVAPADLGVDVFTISDTGDGRGTITLVRSDGASTTWEVAGDIVSHANLVPDWSGGAIWQPWPDGDSPGSSAPIEHLDATGSRDVLLPASSDPGDRFTLRGRGDAGVFVEHRTGTTPDDMRISILEAMPGSDPAVILPPVPGWESAYGAVAGLEVVVYTLSSESTQVLYVDPPDRDRIEVMTGDFASGAYIRDHALDQRGTGYVLFAEEESTGDPTAVVHVYDAFAESPSVDVTVDVPLRLGLADDTPRVVPEDISVAGDLVLVNRTTEDDGYIAPLVWDTSRSTRTWEVVGVGGRAVLGPATSTPTETPPPACAEDYQALRNAPPSDGFALYLRCDGDTEPWHAYRLPLAESATGDPETDAAMVLDALFGVLPQELRDRGYSGLSLDVYAEDSGLTDPELGSLRFEGGTLIVDFDAPDGYGNYGTTFGGSVFHTLVAANLLQLDGVATVELHNRGSCEAHAAMFEGEGCFRFTEDEHAPWVIGDGV